MGGVQEQLAFPGWEDEGQDEAPLPRFAINVDRCMRCGDCARACPHHAIAAANGRTLRILEERCCACGACYEVCPTGAVYSIGTDR